MSRASVHIVRGLLEHLVRLGGAATGASIFAVITLQADWRWVGIGVGGLIVALLAVWLVAYFPPGRLDEP